MKDAIQNFKLPQEVKDKFNKVCKKKHTTASHELTIFVHKYIEDNETKPEADQTH